MGSRLSRRSFLAGLPMVAGTGLLHPVSVFASGPPAVMPVAEGFPRLDPATIQAFVGVAHRDAAEVRRMVERQPALARASWDWGFGDWESALGAASHTGRREIAEIVLAHGAHPTLFSAAMLGQLDVVKAMVAASPSIQRTPGPHGLTLLHHARTGGTAAEPVVAFLEAAGDADIRAATVPLDPADRAALVGHYRFGGGERDRFEVDIKNEQLGLQRPGATRGLLMHAGALVFFPGGVPSVKIAFARSGASITQLTIADPEVYLTARREG
ncbi:MAG: hypothetical protein ABIS67_07580 [Candidatus Eisenbacteria bacterium]